MSYDTPAFYDAIRGPLFSGHISQPQFDGLSALLAAWDAWEPANRDISPNVRWLAYALATAIHETSHTLQPIAEIGHGAGRDYGVPDVKTGLVYYGRGYVQLTWKANYQVQGQRLNVDLEHQPDLALRPDLAANILLHGMAHGQFTGRRLGQYFGASQAHDDPMGARRIINGQDCAGLIAGYYRAFLKGLTA